MISNGLKYGISFLSLVLFQGLILNNVELGGYINPYLYVLFIISLPFETSRWLALILGFVIGVSIDSFTNTPGMHTSATVFLAFFRTYLLKIIEPRDGYAFNTKPNIHFMGITWYLVYVSTLVLIHHILLFYLEAFKLTPFFNILARVFLSSIFTVVLILIVQLFNYKPRTRV